MRQEHERSGKGTFIHAFCSGRAALWQKELQIKYLGERAFFPLEARLKNVCGGQNVLVWAIFNCSRNLQIDPALPGIDKTSGVGTNNSCIVSHAVGLGENLPTERDFASQLASSLQSFLHSGNGTFELVSSIKSIHNSITMTTMPSLLPSIFLNGRVPEFTYKGDYHSGKRHGHGKAVFPEGRTYVGDWRENKMHGYGTITFPSGNTYTGDFNNDKKHGFGVFVFPEGSWYEGDYVSDKKHGQGTYGWPDGSYYSGAWENNMKHGKGKVRDANGGVA